MPGSALTVTSCVPSLYLPSPAPMPRWQPVQLLAGGGGGGALIGISAATACPMNATAAASASANVFMVNPQISGIEAEPQSLTPGNDRTNASCSASGDATPTGTGDCGFFHGGTPAGQSLAGCPPANRRSNR